MSIMTGQLAQDMVGDWLATPVNGYLGSNYGQDLKRILHTPMASPAADAQLAKLREDVPVLGILPSNAINIYAQSRDYDIKMIYIEVAGQTFEFGG
ncbi:MAG: hypothetical protein EOM21_19775 [Gammaproteobacteria bacterium]|nr:hypothetical protein [Gammaproteobacteria bacterium]